MLDGSPDNANEKTVSELAHSIGKDISSKVTKENELWYITFLQYLTQEKNFLQKGEILLDLKTYLDLYLAFTNYWVDVSNDKQRHPRISSFTNAKVSEWFSGDGDDNQQLEMFRTQKHDVLTRLRDQNLIQKMYLMCSGSEQIAKKNKLATFQEIKNDWGLRSDSNRSDYLEHLHTRPEDAFVFKFNLNDFEFDASFTEFIFFGSVTDEGSASKVGWEWCVASTYSDDTRYIKVIFISLTTSGEKTLLEAKNNIGHVKLSDAGVAPPNFKTTFAQFNDHLERPGYADVIPFTSLISIQDKWKFASQIFHSENHDDEVFKALVTEKIGADKGKSILDCAAGTGHHLYQLAGLGYTNLYGSEYRGDEVTILKGSLQDLGGKVAGIPCFKANWCTLDDDIKAEISSSNANAHGTTALSSLPNDGFDHIMCLGTSLPYYESWDEHEEGGKKEFTSERLKSVLEQFRQCLASGGSLVIGLSRSIDLSDSSDLTYTKFPPTDIQISSTDKSTESHEVNTEMEWRFQYNRSKNTRNWQCRFIGGIEEQSFSAVGHLFDHYQLKELCDQVFENTLTVVHDADPEAQKSYDKYVIATKD